MTTERSAHWDQAYRDGDTSRSWYQQHAETSMALITESAIRRTDSIIDIGGGASTLADDLLAEGFTDITVLDVSRTGIDTARTRLGKKAEGVRWIIDDLLAWHPQRAYDLWHDRAVLHFLVDPIEQQRYRAALLAATRPGSTVIVGVFGLDGPTSCSGLPVQRFDRATLAETLGDELAIERIQTAEHQTPTGAVQQFFWAVAARRR
ncbi:MAG: class I SAM-dependent methyltransferase [Actinomycetes bacterium]